MQTQNSSLVIYFYKNVRGLKEGEQSPAPCSCVGRVLFFQLNVICKKGPVCGSHSLLTSKMTRDCFTNMTLWYICGSCWHFCA